MKDPARCKICGSARLVRLAHTARCRDCGVLLYYPYPAGSLPCLTTDEEKLSWYGASARFNHSNFTRMLRYAVTDEDVREELSVLDYGGGGGQFALVCKSHFPRAAVYLVDINDDSALEGWSGCNRRIRFEDFPRDPTRFDLIFLNDVFEHLDDPVGTLSLLADKLTSRGRIFIDTPRQFWLYPLSRFLAPPLHVRILRGTVSPQHLQIWTDAALRRVVRQCGLSIRKWSTWAEFTMPPDFYLDNMQIRSRAVRLLGHALYAAAGLILRNKVVCLLERGTR